MCPTDFVDNLSNSYVSVLEMYSIVTSYNMFNFGYIFLFTIYFTLVSSQLFDEIDLIYGGTYINITDAPYQVSVQLGGSMVCGGAIFAPTFVLTAGHCILRSTIYYNVRAGTSDQLLGGTIHKVQSFKVHPLYNDELYDYDIAILEVDPPFDYDDFRQPIDLATEEMTIGNVTISGWGTFDDTVETSRMLQAVTIPFVSDAECNEDYAEYGGITSRMFCAGLPGFDSCLGDSGSPVVHDGKLAGLVSWAVGCALEGYPGVNTKISHPEILEFISLVTGVAIL